MKQDHINLLSLPILSILRSRAFFDDVYALSDCFIGLAQLGAALKTLPDSDHRMFKHQSIAIFNKRFVEFNDNIYLLCFFLHPNYDGL